MFMHSTCRALSRALIHGTAAAFFVAVVSGQSPLGLPSEAKTEDPVILTRPWTARYPLKLDNSYEWWEYACHEGNRTIGDYINASRAERARQSEAK
jgi:hypothetical protein